MKSLTTKTVVIIITLLVLTTSASFARNKEGEPTTVEVVSMKTTGKVEGVVKDLETGKPIQNAVVFIEGCKTGAMTNESGKFYLRNVPCGTCTLKVSKTGYELSEDILLVKDNQKTSVKVGMALQAS